MASAADIATRVSVTMHEGIAHVRLTRPDKRNALDDAIKKFLAKGGKITQVPAGITTLGAIADHEARRKLDRIKSFGDKG